MADQDTGLINDEIVERCGKNHATQNDDVACTVDSDNFPTPQTRVVATGKGRYITNYYVIAAATGADGHGKDDIDIATLYRTAIHRKTFVLRDEHVEDYEEINSGVYGMEEQNVILFSTN